MDEEFRPACLGTRTRPGPEPGPHPGGTAGLAEGTQPTELLVEIEQAHRRDPDAGTWGTGDTGLVTRIHAVETLLQWI